MANDCNISLNDDCKEDKIKTYPQRCLNQQFFKVVKPPLITAITGFVSHAPVICEKPEQVVF